MIPEHKSIEMDVNDDSPIMKHQFALCRLIPVPEARSEQRMKRGESEASELKLLITAMRFGAETEPSMRTKLWPASFMALPMMSMCVVN